MTLAKQLFSTKTELLSHLGLFPFQGGDAEKLRTIIEVAFENNLLAEPALDSEAALSKESYLQWIEDKYHKSKANSCRVKKGTPPKTIADPLVSLLLSDRFDFDIERTEEISRYHRLSMQAEIHIGSLLEEYLEEELEGTGWLLCHGHIVKHSDFCHPKNKILQIKNRDNTENSSSKAIRDGKPHISMWYRTCSRDGGTNWPALYKHLAILPTDKGQYVSGKLVNVSEERFKQFAIQILRNNPRLIYG